MRRLAQIALAGVVALALGASPAGAADFGLNGLDVTFAPNEGTPLHQAGSHPAELTTVIGVNTEETEAGEVPINEVKDLIVEQVPGLVGNPTATPRCAAADFNDRDEGRPSCPDSTAVGYAAVKAEFTVLPPETNLYLHVPLYNLVPSPGQPAKLGFVALNVPVTVDLGVNSEPPHNIVAEVTNIPQSVLFYGSELTIWGNPASDEHNALRGDCVGEPIELTAEAISLGTCDVDVAEAPFLTLPRSCQGPLSTEFSAESWQALGVFTDPLKVLSHDEAEPSNPLGMTGCDGLNFDPEVSAEPTTTAAESPAGLEVDLGMNDVGLSEPTGRAKSDIRKVVVTLPTGVTANPSAAEGLGVCTAAQYAAATVSSAGCPGSSKLGTIEVETPLLEQSIEGSLYLASPEDNPFGTLIALYVVLRHPGYGILIKQAGKVVPDPGTGQLVSTFEELPQLPFSSFKLRFREGPRAPLVTPPTCGTYTTEARLTPWSGGAEARSTSSFTITSGPNGGGCPTAGVPPFNPGFQAGTLSNSAGSYSPFYMRLTRNDGEQDMTRFDSILPPGVSGKIAGVPVCSEAAIAAAAAKTGRAELAAPSCPVGSRIGGVLVGAGVGPSLTYVPGSIYLAGPHAGAPLSLAVVTPAVAGPFDVGTVVVREALNLDPNTAEVSVDGAASDPIPHILEGIPLKLRDLRVQIDRPEFTLNATSCNPFTVRASLFGSAADPFSAADDTAVPLSARYQASNCARLGFKPKLNLRLKGATKRAKNPGLRAELKSRGADANLKGAIVNLPPSQFIDNAHISNPCTRVQFNANNCPKRSILGRARAFTPLLDEPLEGNVYFRSNGGARELPDVVAALKGQFEFNLVIAVLRSNNGRIRTKVLNAPDVPVSKFVLNMFAGKRSLLENSEWLCRKKQRAYLNLIGQNADRYKTKPVIKTSCSSKKKSKRLKRHDRRR